MLRNTFYSELLFLVAKPYAANDATLDSPVGCLEKNGWLPIRAARFANAVLDAPDAGESKVSVGRGLLDK